MRTIRLATRGSKLALAQADIVAKSLKTQEYAVEIMTVSTRGDKDQVSPLTKIGGKGLFVSEIETYLLDGRADIAVHSGKDLPYKLAEGLIIGGTPPAAAPNDCLITLPGVSFGLGSIIGTSSPRRTLECRKFYPEATYENIRGNVDTRLRKLRGRQYDGILLAKAGLDRLQVDLSQFQVRVFSPTEFLPSPCQGIIAVECRETDTEIRKLLETLRDETAWRRFQAEREMLCLLQADCSAALGAYCTLDGDTATITGLLNGRKASRTGPWAEYPALCRAVLNEITK